ncbi:hypothetical protein K443DRAFT_679261 [Laccaria amethystina LaAM-08-1]|uniref:Uncharacterized protein n=1 Tax=Laccaria amethystina LaAM-08-1 TaxID=1095629 RepID=A0A0C9WQ29_9AGAR|nr:hypothetical protein K443DRAFT_679261 [Laccaria amethystina LaAM-08-1]
MPLSPPFSAAATRLLPPNSTFPSTTYSRLQNPTTLLTLSPSSSIMSIIGKAFHTVRTHSLLVSARCKCDGARILGKMRFSSCSMSTSGYHGRFGRILFNGKVGGGLLNCKGGALNVHGTPFAHPVYLQILSPETQGHGELASPPLWCRRFDSSAGTGVWKRSRSDQSGYYDGCVAVVSMAIL